MADMALVKNFFYIEKVDISKKWMIDVFDSNNWAVEEDGRGEGILYLELKNKELNFYEHLEED